jgi:hypothetical protein
MKVLTRKKKEKKGYILVCLDDAVLRRHIRHLVSEGFYLQAINEARSSGGGLRPVEEPEVWKESASLILTEKSAHWDAAV